MRYFNTHGPVEAEKHYVVSRQSLVDKLSTQIDQGKYFTIFAPRQMGKTTLLRKLEEILVENPDYLPVPLSFERFECWSASDFLDEVGELITYHISQTPQVSAHPHRQEIKNLLTGHPPKSYQTFEHFFRNLYEVASDLKVVLIIDEFDAIPQNALTPLLQTWRAMYLEKRPPHSLHSVILIGIQNIARLNLGRSSPFNIAYQQRLNGFTFDEVQEMMAQYTTDTRQVFEPDALSMLHEQTAGHPFLINRTAAILTEEIVPDQSRSLTTNDLRTALNQLVRETNYNFETIIRHASEYHDDVINILFGGRYKFNLNNSMVNDLYTQGVIGQDQYDNCQIANPIYSEVLLAAFRPVRVDYQATILVNGYDFRPHAVDGQLQMMVLLSRFRKFVERRGREAFKVTEMPQEATGQYLLMAYLDLIVRQLGGDLFTEVDSGEGRLDLIVVYQGHRYVIETKIWRGPVEFDNGLEQLAAYLTTEGEENGYYVVFHARPNVYGQLAHDELEFEINQDGKQILVYLVRLGLPDELKN
ncbi:ATP-binding protein [Chloroflexi bacterium TSY]|nr:ATP-binding protein [Chloroflexi bacterium TSY]